MTETGSDSCPEFSLRDRLGTALLTGVTGLFVGGLLALLSASAWMRRESGLDVAGTAVLAFAAVMALLGFLRVERMAVRVISRVCEVIVHWV